MIKNIMYFIIIIALMGFVISTIKQTSNCVLVKNASNEIIGQACGFNLVGFTLK